MLCSGRAADDLIAAAGPLISQLGGLFYFEAEATAKAGELGLSQGLRRHWIFVALLLFGGALQAWGSWPTIRR